MPHRLDNAIARDMLQRASDHAGSARQLALAIGQDERKIQRLVSGKTETVDVDTYGGLLDFMEEQGLAAEPQRNDSGSHSPGGEPPLDDLRAGGDIGGGGSSRITPVRVEPAGGYSGGVSIMYQLPTGLVRIPQVTVEAGAGDGSIVDFEEVEGYVIYPEWQIRQEYGVDPARVKEIRTRGSSMEPTIMPGQRLLVALWDGQPLHDGLVYVIHGPGGVQVKRLFIEPDHIHIWSDNGDAPRYRVTLEVWDREYRVLAVALEINRKL